MRSFDLFVIGSGPSGGRVAMKCAESGLNVAIAESRMFGGNCALRGCNPKKVFVHAAEIVDAARRGNGKLCDAGDIKIDWANLLTWKNKFTQPVPQSSVEKFQDAGITTIEGCPKFISENLLDVDGTHFSAQNILIANHNILDRQSALRNSWDDSEREKRIVVGKLMQSRLAQLVLDFV